MLRKIRKEKNKDYQEEQATQKKNKRMINKIEEMICCAAARCIIYRMG
jgi:hypothetical protein